MPIDSKDGKPTLRVEAEIAAAMRVPGHSHVYCLVPFGGPVTFHSQQRRAFNLIWALAETREIKLGTNVGIIGGGLAGMTCAAAAGMVGCRVTMIESEPDVLHQQRGNHTRYIHPNILDWPSRNATNPHTDLPYLNWTADICKEVVKEVEAQFSNVPNVEKRFSRSVESIKSKMDGVILKMDPFDEDRFDCVIACIGFGKEKRFQTCLDQLTGRMIHFISLTSVLE
jgi:L-2-hydroxyglutarate oxidase LhgO